MVIAVPTGIKIFSWLEQSFISQTLFKLINNTLLKNKNLFSENYNSKNYNLLSIFKRSNRVYMEPNNICKSLVVYGTNIESTVGYKKYTDIVSYMVELPNNIIYILTGLILSDGYINIISKKENSVEGLHFRLNSRFYFKQSLIHVDYLWYIFTLLSHYCISYPKLKITRLKGKSYYSCEFYTRSLPCMTYLRHKFYKGRVKIIPLDIYDYISYESLAHIIMGDGSLSKGGGMTLNLQCFTIQELVLFINVLKIKFDIDCTIHKNRHQYIVYIKSNSMKKLYPFIKEYIIPSMKYKFDSKFIDN